MPESFWERAMVIGAFAIAAAFLLLLAKREFLDGGSPSADESVVGVAATPGLDPESEASFSDVAGSERSPEAAPARPARPRSERAVAPTPVRVDRQDCGALRNVHDRTSSERAWYIENCMFLSRKGKPQRQVESVSADVVEELRAAGFSLDQPSTNRSASDANATPPPDLTPSVAVQKAVDWIPDNTPVAVTVSAEACTPIWLNGHWVVTCNVGIDGCSIAPCEAVLSVCVFPAEPALVPDLLC